MDREARPRCTRRCQLDAPPRLIDPGCVLARAPCTPMMAMRRPARRCRPRSCSRPSASAGPRASGRAPARCSRARGRLVTSAGTPIVPANVVVALPVTVSVLVDAAGVRDAVDRARRVAAQRADRTGLKPARSTAPALNVPVPKTRSVVSRQRVVRAEPHDAGRRVADRRRAGPRVRAVQDDDARCPRRPCSRRRSRRCCR